MATKVITGKPNPDMAAPVDIRRCRHGHFMVIGGDQYVGKCLTQYGEYSEAEVHLFRHFVRPGDMVVEIGANIGALTVPLAHMVGPKGRVIALEPQRAVHNVLCANMALNGLMHVEPLRAAGGAANGSVDIPVIGYGRDFNYGSTPARRIKGVPMEKVPVLALDSLGLPNVSLLKVDVEGAEDAVIAGAAQTIGRLRPALCVENDRREHSPALIRRLLDLGYHLWWHLSPLYRPDNFHKSPVNTMGNIVSINMLGLPEDAAPALPGLRRVRGPDDWWRQD